MVRDKLDIALETFRGMDEKAAIEVAQTFLLGFLEVDLPEELVDSWESGFSTRKNKEAVSAELDKLCGAGEADLLLRLAVETVVTDHPEKSDFFIQCVEGVGQKMWVVELGVVAIAAAYVMREYYKKGRDIEIVEEEFVGEGGQTHKVRRETHYAKQSGLLAKLLAKLNGLT